jgi:hypothetical protein
MQIPMNKPDLHSVKWFLVSYHNLKTSLVSVQRFHFLRKYLLSKKINVHLITRAEGASSENISIKEPLLSRRWPKLVNSFSLTDRSSWWAVRVASYITDRKQPIILHTTMPHYGVGWVGLLLRLRKIPFFWIADFEDPWTINPVYKPFLSFIKLPLHNILEQIVFKKADLLIFNTATDLKNYRHKYPFITNKSISIRNGFHQVVSNKSHIGSSKEMAFVYAGSVYPKGSTAKAIIAFLDQLNINGFPAKCDFYGNHHPSLDSSEHVNYCGSISYLEVPNLLNQYRMGIIFLQEVCIGGGRITQKFYDYIASGVIPIVINPSDEIIQQLELLNTGISIFPKDDMRKIAKHVKELYFSDFTFDPKDLEPYSRQYQFDLFFDYLLQ